MTGVLDSIPWARRLKIRHLEVFVALHETGSLTGAAARLHMTQPALSHWLADVEEVVGRALFVRGRRLTLTEEGEVMLAHASRMLGDVQRTHAELQAVRSGMRGRLHVGTGLPRVLLPRAIARLHAERPGVFVSVVEAPLPELLDSLDKREIDVIIGALGVLALQSGFATESLLKDSVQVVARRGHPLLKQAQPHWQDTRAFPWILPPAGSVMRTAIDDAFGQQGLQPPTPCVEGNSSIRAQLLMSDPNYLSILSTSEVQLYLPLEFIASVPLTPTIAFPDIGAIWSLDRSGSVVSAFLEVLRTESRAMTSTRTVPGGRKKALT